MILKEKERTVIQDLQTQEKSCVEKYGRYAEQAKDPELKNLFQTIQKEEQKHYDSLTQVLDGQVPQCDCNDSDGKDYEPKQTYKRDICIWRERGEKASGGYTDRGAESCGDALQV